ncbi:MAG TPA: hypothetical protein VHE80_07275, partial [Acidimicrobiales bacterium]|nr:hypothetical protein [Acidimicrobiales bacterium]
QPDRAFPKARLLASGTVGSRQWELYGIDEVDPKGEKPCFRWSVHGDGFESAADGSWACVPEASRDKAVPFHSLGPIFRDDGETLYLGIVGWSVTTVGVTGGRSRQTAELRPFADPAHPAGARLVVATVPDAGRDVVIELRGPDREVLHRQTFGPDSPIGG